MPLWQCSYVGSACRLSAFVGPNDGGFKLDVWFRDLLVYLLLCRLVEFFEGFSA